MTQRTSILSRLCVPVLALLSVPFVHAQEATISGVLFGKGGKPKLAVTDFRGTGNAASFMTTFNATVFADVQNSGMVDMVSKSLYPVQTPQRLEDLHPQSGVGLALQDWSGPPPNASHLAFGYTAEQNGTFVAYGFLVDARQPLTNTPPIGKRYFATLDENGARKAAHEYANDIIAFFGGGSLAGTKIYFVSDRTGNKEIWVMDYDGTNQRQLSHSHGSLNIMPGVSPDGSLLAYTSFRSGRPQIDILETASGRLRGFLNPGASVNSTPCFTPDGKSLYFASSLGGPQQIYRSGITGSGLTRISHSTAIETEPKVNPMNPNQLVFVSGRTGPQQIFSMNSEGLDVQRLTNGEGEASNPSWNPNGQHILFSWTRGYAKGDWNIFLMDVASRSYEQLTHSEGRNENPVWAPDGRHLVFGSNRGGSYQIWSMLANGTAVTRLTNQGHNWQPVWSK